MREVPPGSWRSARALLLDPRAQRAIDERADRAEHCGVHDSLGFEEEAVEHYGVARCARELTDDESGVASTLGLGSTYRALGRDADAERAVLRA